MEVFHKINENKNLAIALGYFDGIHVGHRKIINILINKAKEKNLKTAIVTFEKNPANYFINHSQLPNLSSNQPLEQPATHILDIQGYKDKELILQELGVDYLYELDFEEYKDLSAREYLQDVLIKNFAPQYIIAGYNHTFGKGRIGNCQFLKEGEEEFNYNAIIVPEEKYKGREKISSTIIRKKIQKGQLSSIKALLGRPYSIRNSVIKGDNIAKSLGYPTANLFWPHSLVKLPYGVYFGFAQTNSKTIPALISWGNKPTLSNAESEILEAHLYNFNKSLYGKIINVVFLEKLREQKKFPSKIELQKQLRQDYCLFKDWVEKTYK